MTTLLNAARGFAPARMPTAGIRVTLLGLGNVGLAVANHASSHAGQRFTIVSALVRDLSRLRPLDTGPIMITADPDAALAAAPDVVVELLGGLEPARSLVLSALSKGVPVVTANKALLAHHGDELFGAAARHRTALLYEASVIAGVPFLGMFGRRPLAREVTALTGIVNGTSNFVLSRMASARLSFERALADAQRAGYAEPEPAKDVSGDDAVEKLCVLVRHFAGLAAAPGDIEKTGIAGLDLEDLRQAAVFGGAIRPVVTAEWSGDCLRAHAGPTFVDGANPLARVEGVQNAIAIKTRWSGDLFFSGPGAGPSVTAATVLDDVAEAVHPVIGSLAGSAQAAASVAPDTGWFVRLTCATLVNEQEAPARLASLGVRVRRISPVVPGAGVARQWLLIRPCARAHITAALDVLLAGKRGAASLWRAIE